MLEFRVLGSVEVVDGDGPLALGGPKQRALLVLLLLHRGEAVSSDRLIDQIWGERPPASANKIVQGYVSNLRRVLGDGRLATRGRGYLLQTEPSQIDVDRFESLLAEGRRALGDGDPHRGVERLREALALWRGPPLADFAYEPFAQAEIARLEELRLVALEERIDAELALREHVRLVGELEGLVREHPLRERLRAQLMLALYRSGRQADALEAYRDARRELLDGLGLEPGRALQELERAILAHDPGLDLRAGHSARPPPAAARNRLRGAAVIAAAGALALLGGVAIYAVSRSSDQHGLARIDQNAVGVIDPHAARIAAQYPVGRAPSALTAGGGSMWAINTLDSTVSRIDRERDQIVRIPVGDGPTGLAFAARSLWVTESQNGTVAQISPAADRVVQTIGVGNAPGAIVAGFGALWIASQVDPTVVRVDLATGAPTTIGLGSVPTAIAAGAGAVWVTSEESGTVYRIDPRSRNVVDAIGVGNGPIGVAAGEGAVWVANRQDGTVSRIDPATDAMTDVMPVGRGPSAIAAGDGGVWVADSSDATVTRIDPNTRRVANIVRVTSSPSAIAVADGSVWTAVKAPPASHRGGTLRVQTQFLLGGDPQDDPSGPASLVYDGLVAYRRAGGGTFGTLVGDLATEVPKPSVDGRTYVFRLRPDIRYSNGAPVRPGDFRAALEAVFRRHPSAPLPDAYRNIKGVPACVRTPSRCDLLRGIGTDARARTITLHLSDPNPDLLYYLTYPFGYLVPAGHPFGRKTLPPGTGPYKVASFDPRRGAELVRNPYFRVWSNDARPAGFADRIDVSVGHDINKQVAAVQRGRADVVVVDSLFGGGLPPAAIRALATRGAGQLYTDPTPELDYMFLNVRTPPFDDVRVRRAVNYAVDRRQVSQLAGGPALARPICQFVPPGFPGYIRSCPYTLDPGPGGAWTAPDTEQARHLIRQSGTAGMAVTVWGYRDKRPIIRYFAALLHQLGYHTSVRLFADYGHYRDKVGDPRTRAQIGIDGWSPDIGAPSNFTPPFLCSSIASGFNESGYCDRRLERRIEVALSARGTRAIALWNDVYRRLADAAPAVPLVNRRSVTLVSDRVGNYQSHPWWSTLLDQLWVR